MTKVPEQVQLLVLVAYDLDAKTVEFERVSDECWTVYVFTEDELEIWRASKGSQSGRWTLTPCY